MPVIPYQEPYQGKGEVKYVNVNAAVRPIRAVILVPNDQHWKTYVLGAIDVAARSWGGKNYILVPTDGKTIDQIFWNHMETYDPDKIILYEPSLGDVKIADPNRYSEIRELNRKTWNVGEKFDEMWDEKEHELRYGFTITDSLQEELKNRLSPFCFENNVVDHYAHVGEALSFPFTRVQDIVHESSARQDILLPPDIDNIYDLVTKSTIGWLSEKSTIELGKSGIGVANADSVPELNEYIVRVQDIDNKYRDYQSEQTVFELLYEMSPFEFSMLSLNTYHLNNRHHEHKEPLNVVVGDSLEDIALYYNLKKMHGSGVCFLSYEMFDKAHKEMKELQKNGHKTERTSNLKLIHRLVSQYGDYVRNKDSKVIQLTSISIHEQKFHIVIKKIASMSYVNIAWLESMMSYIKPANIDLSCRQFTIEGENFNNQQDMVIVDGNSVGTVKTPKPSKFRKVDPSNHRWVTTLTIKDYLAPRLPGLGQKIVKTINLGHETKTSLEGISYLSPNVMHFGEDIDSNLVKPVLSILEPQDIFTHYFALSGYTISQSDKGGYFSDTVKRFGSLENAATFMSSKHGTGILEGFMSKQKSDSGRVYLGESTFKRSYLNIGGISSLTSNEQEAKKIVDYLLERNIIYRGLILQCSLCKLAGWYDLGDLSQHFTCNRCNETQKILSANWKMPSEPIWYFKLAETVHQFYSHNSHVTLLALEALRRGAEESFMYLGEMNIIDEKGKQQEIDILAVVDGKICIGECKTSDPKSGDVTKYAPIVSYLAVKPNTFIYATINDKVTPSVVTTIEGIGIKHALLVKDDLYGPVANIAT